jgi:hypothetical protein
MTRQEILDLLQPVQVEHLKSSMNLIDQEGVPKGRSSQLYVVLDQERGKSYPPPLLLEIAYQLATGKQLPLGFFNMIKKDGPHFEKIKSLGYQVTDKVDPLLQLISDYKGHIRETKLSDELYKWELLGKFKGRPNLDAADFGEELRSVNYGNFLYAMSSGVLRGLAKHAPEEMRGIVRNLVDETKSLKDRIETYSKETFALYRRLEPENELNHHQDERTAATLLTFYAPDKYTLYKSSFYVKYCEFLGIKQRGKGEKYVHYLELVQQFVQEYIQNDKELIELVDSFLPTSAYRDTQHLILAQDILYHHFNKFNGSVDIFKTIQQFLDQAKTGDLKTAFYPKVYEGLTMKVSFGQGGPARVPWISFTKEPHTTSKGIYPVFLHYKEHNQLVLAYGISETEDSGYTWPNTDGLETITDWFQRTYNQRPDRYGASYIKGIYDTKDLDKELLENDLLELIQEYKGINESTKQKSEERPKQPTGMKLPLNQILYGPPGTGKTYTLKTDYFPQYTTKEINLTKEQHFENIVRDLTWWQVIAVALVQTGKTKVGTLLNHPWILQKARLSSSNTVRPTLWGQLQSHTIPSCEFVNVKAKQAPYLFNKTEDSYWEIVEDEVKEQYPELYDLIDSVEHFNPSSDKEIKRYIFTTFHQSFNYEDFIEGIKPVLTDEIDSGDVAYRIEDGIFKELCKRAETDPDNRYAIFIDEINRGNVSNIFGELITLIETDKRKGAEHAMSAMLPYSKKAFAVPSNVDIYGTMNTADRSVEALDTALRRRFSFTEMLPKPNLIKTAGPLKANNGILQGIDLALLLSTINKRIEKLLDKDHQIGHSYFLKVDSLDSLKSAFHNAIIPLLQEYFFGDYGKIGLVLGQGFFEELESSEDEKFFAEFKDYEIDGILDKRVYHIKDVTQLDDSSFIAIVKAILPRQ